MEKVCPMCGKDLSPTAVKCDNPSCPNPRAVALAPAQPKNRKRDDYGSGGRRSPERVNIITNKPINNQFNKVFVPGFNNIKADNVSNFSMVKPKIDPIVKNTRPISDDEVEVVEESHLEDIENSADSLGL